MSAQTAAAAIAALVSLAATAVVARRALTRPAARAPMLAWLIGFALFSVAELALWYGAANGWTPAAFRIYYLAGGILVVPFLAVGELLLVAPGRRFTRLAVATMLWVTFASAAAVIAADVDAAQLASAGATPPNDAMGGPWTTILAVVLTRSAPCPGRRLAGVRPAPPRPAAAAGRRRRAGDRADRVGDAAGQLRPVRRRAGDGHRADHARPGAAALSRARLRSPATPRGRPGPSCAMRRCGGSRLRAAARSSSVCSRRWAVATASSSPDSTASSQPAEQRLDLRAIAQVLEPLPGRGADALGLLLGVRHRKTPLAGRRDDSRAGPAEAAGRLPRRWRSTVDWPYPPRRSGRPPPCPASPALSGRASRPPSSAPGRRCRRSTSPSTCPTWCAASWRTTPSPARSCRCSSSCARRARSGRPGGSRGWCCGRPPCCWARSAPCSCWRRRCTCTCCCTARTTSPPTWSSRSPGSCSRSCAILGMTGVVTGILNSERIFGVPAFAPVAWNLVIILALVLFARGKPLDEGVEVYAWGVLVATVVQFLIPLPLLRGRGTGLAWRLGFGNPHVRRILKLMIPVSIGLGLININLTLDTVIAIQHSGSRRRRPELRVPPVHAAAGAVLGGRLDRAVPRAGAARGAARPGRRRPDRLRRRRARSSSCCCRPPRSRSCWRSRSSGCSTSTASSPATATRRRLAGADGVLARAGRQTACRCF